MEKFDDGGIAPYLAGLSEGRQVLDPEACEDWPRFRQAARTRLLQARMSLRTELREAWTTAIIRELEEVTSCMSEQCIATYWPALGEPDLRPWMHDLHERGVTVALPFISGRWKPFQFRQWVPGCYMVGGDWDMVSPARGETVEPDLIIAPVLGIDDDCYMLGNGGGYYDSTITALDRKVLVIGVGFPNCVISTIRPMPWDRPMDLVILGDGRARLCYQ